MRFILTPVGSSGDVNPFVSVGRGLQARGHEVILFAPEPYGDVVRGAGLAFESSISTDEYERTVADSGLWDPWNGLSVILRTVASNLEANFSKIESLYLEGETVLVGHSLSLATRLLEEVKGCPAATIHLSPNTFRSDYRQPALAPGRDFSGAPRWVKRLFWRLADSLVADPPIRNSLNKLRRTLGLPPVDRIFNEWYHSPQRIIGLFPNWFGMPQPDWPVRLRQTGFVFNDDSNTPPLSDELETFLAAGDRPLLITPGSANRHAARLLKAGLDGAQMLGRRLIILTPYKDQLPEVETSGVFHVPQIPFSKIFPRCAAIIHHGGIGTCAAALAAGVPQLIVPFGFDQPDNATRLVRLGLARYLDLDRTSHIRIAEYTKELLTSPSVEETCRHYREVLESENGLEKTLDVLEALIRRGVSTA
ncbi:MAG: glycosyltransferase [Opitutaceae bacterium]